MADKRFPLLAHQDLGCPKDVPWDFVAPHETQAFTNHGQGLTVLARRGGLGVAELVAVVHGQDRDEILGADTHKVPELLRLLADYESRRTQAADAWNALAFAVRNNGVDDKPVGGVAVVLHYKPEEERYHADFEGCEANGGASASTLEEAVLALRYLDEGEGVIVGEDGLAACPECDAAVRAFLKDHKVVLADCPECDNTRVNQSPPHAWPPNGLQEVG